MLKRFMYASIGILALAHALNLGAKSAESGVDCVKIADVQNTGWGQVVLIVDNNIQRWDYDQIGGLSLELIEPLPRSGTVMDVGVAQLHGKPGIWVVFGDGEVYAWTQFGGWELPANACDVVSSVPSHAPVSVGIGGIRPNPFNPSATIDYAVPQRGTVALEVYDAAGRLARSLVEGEVEPGKQSIAWDGRDDNGYVLPSGTYFYSLSLDGQVLDKGKAVILK